MSLPLHLHNRFATQHLMLDGLLQHATDRELREPITHGKWSVHEQLAHLGRYQEVFAERINDIVSNSAPAFPRYVADADPEFARWKRRAVKVNFDMLKTQRNLLVARFKTLGATTLSRTGIHPVYGRLTITEWVEFFLLHEAHHLFAIFKAITAARGK
ncbi:MAG: DinB family protein [Bacteroidia bacterium]